MSRALVYGGVVGVLACATVIAGCSSSAPHTSPSTLTSASLASGSTSAGGGPSSASSRAVGSSSGGSPAAPAGPGGGPVPRGFVAASVTFISDQVGWVLGTAPCASAPCTSVLRTRDGGASWVGVPAPRVALEGGNDSAGSIRQIRFADARNGFADGNGLWTTHNGGGSWQRQHTVAGVANAVVTDLAATPSGVYALVSGTAATYGGSDSHLRLTRSDPATGAFQVVTDLGPKLFASPMVSSGGVVYFLTGAAGQAATRLIRVAGTTVTRTSLPARGCTELAASTPTALLVQCGQGVASGSMGGRHLYGSTDSGRRFTRLPDPGRGAGYDNTGIADAGLGNAVLATAGANTGALLTTTTSAATWHPTLTLPNTVFGELGFQDHTHGTVIANPTAAAAEQADPHTPSTGPGRPAVPHHQQRPNLEPRPLLGDPRDVAEPAIVVRHSERGTSRNASWQDSRITRRWTFPVPQPPSWRACAVRLMRPVFECVDGEGRGSCRRVVGARERPMLLRSHRFPAAVQVLGG